MKVNLKMIKCMEKGNTLLMANTLILGSSRMMISKEMESANGLMAKNMKALG